LALLPRKVVATLVSILVLVALVAPVYGFFQVLPPIEALYHHPLSPGWGLWCMVVGLILIVASYWRPSPKS
jgi:hypothetical protein